MNRKARNKKSTKLQAPEKRQTSSSNHRPAPMVWFLELGISLELGAWSLVLRD
jgi:hypothetical protein